MRPMTDAPKHKKIPQTATRHGIKLTDNYAWLRQSNWQEMFRDTSLLDTEIRAALEAENAYTQRNFIEPNRALIDKIVAEMKSVIEIDYDSAGIQDGEWRYFTRHSELDYPLYLRRHTDGREETLLDPNTEFKKYGNKVFMGDVEHSPDHKFLAVSVDFAGAEDGDIHIKDLATGKFIAKLEHADRPVWSPDSKDLYYAKMSEDGDYKRNRVFRHVLGTEQKDDVLILQNDDPRFFLSIAATPSHRYLKIILDNSTSKEVSVLDFNRPDAELIRFAPHTDNILYKVDHHGDYFYIHTNADNAVDFKIMRTPVSAPERANWQEWEPHEPGRYIENFTCFENHIVRFERQDALPRIAVIDMKTGETSHIAFDDAAYHLSIGNAAGFHSPLLRIHYSSPRQPTQDIDYDMVTGSRKVMREEKIAGHDPDDYIVERIYVTSHDGVKVPLTITRHKDTKLDGTNPCHLYAYGSYGHPLPAFFGWFKKRFPLLKRGFVTAIAHIRGGTDCGFGWYEDGKLMKKKNTFLDFIACAEYLADNKYTSRGKVAIEGASAGGLLMGAVTNMAPQGLLGAVVAIVPYVDVINTMVDTTLPLTPPEWTEWGNPIESKEAFDYMLSYSPYDNLVARDYPPMLVVGGLTDPRVTYWEPAKFTAKLRDVKTDSNPLYQFIEMHSGHYGDPGRFGHLPELARDLCFIIKSVGNFCASDISDEEWNSPEGKGCCG
jgi:oligopeptidase B